MAGLAGFLVYGSWAAYANFDHGMSIATRSGLVQGTYSLVLTFAMTLVTEWLFGRLCRLPGGMVFTVVIVSGVLFATAYVIHRLVGTPEILMTILPGFVIGSIYTSIYVLGLSHGTNAVNESQ